MSDDWPGPADQPSELDQNEVLAALNVGLAPAPAARV
jgi:hypothetical protein